MPVFTACQENNGMKARPDESKVNVGVEFQVRGPKNSGSASKPSIVHVNPDLVIKSPGPCFANVARSRTLSQGGATRSVLK